jgi:hypothetical protein
VHQNWYRIGYTSCSTSYESLLWVFSRSLNILINVMTSFADVTTKTDFYLKIDFFCFPS